MPYKCVVDKNYTNEWVHGKAKTSPDRKYISEIYCVRDVDSFRMYLLLRDRLRNELERVLLAEDIPNEFVFTKYLGKIEWISGEEVGMIAKDPASHWIVKVRGNERPTLQIE